MFALLGPPHGPMCSMTDSGRLRPVTASSSDRSEHLVPRIVFQMRNRYASVLDSSLSSPFCTKCRSGSSFSPSGSSAICEYSDSARAGFGGGAGPMPANAAIISTASQRYRSFQGRRARIALEEGSLFSSSTEKITFVQMQSHTNPFAVHVR